MLLQHLRALALLPAFALLSCEPTDQAPTGGTPAAETPTAEIGKKRLHPVVRINSTLQPWSTGRPWQKEDTSTRGGLGVALTGGKILTVAEMVTDAIYIELLDAQGLERIRAEVVSIDYGANLALLAPAATDDEGTFLDDLEPVKLAEPLALGDKIDIVQLESTGEEVISEGTLQRYDVMSTLVDEQYLLTYLFKSSLQSATDSFTVPTFANGALVGLLYSYDSEDQISTVIPLETISRFLEDAVDGEYSGFPDVGIGAFTLDDRHFRDFLGLETNGQGIYVTSVVPDSAAAQAGIEKGDVLLAVNGHEIDSLGYYENDIYGRLNWMNIVRGDGRIGDEIEYTISRGGEVQNIPVTLTALDRSADPIPSHSYDVAPNFLIKGGLIFQELSVPFMQRFGKEWRSKGPLDLLRILKDSSEVETERVIVLAGVIPTPATVGYDGFRNQIVKEINGRKIGSIADADAAFSVLGRQIHQILIDAKPDTLYLDTNLANEIDQQLLQRGIPLLKRVGQQE